MEKLWFGTYKEFSTSEEYLFKRTRLCIPLRSLRYVVILERHASGLVGHFGGAKTLALIGSQFYWPRMEKDVNKGNFKVSSLSFG